MFQQRWITHVNASAKLYQDLYFEIAFYQITFTLVSPSEKNLCQGWSQWDSSKMSSWLRAPDSCSLSPSRGAWSCRCLESKGAPWTSFELKHPFTCLLKWVWLFSAFLHLSKWPHFKIHAYTEHTRTFHIWFLQCNGFASFVMVSCTRCRNAETYGKENQLQQKLASSHCCRFLAYRWRTSKIVLANSQNDLDSHWHSTFLINSLSPKQCNAEPCLLSSSKEAIPEKSCDYGN